MNGSICLRNVTPNILLNELYNFQQANGHVSIQRSVLSGLRSNYSHVEEWCNKNVHCKEMHNKMKRSYVFGLRKEIIIC